MHLRPDVKRELRHIGVGCAVGAVVLSAGWGALAAAGAGIPFGWPVPLSAALGAGAAWLNFFGLAITLQKAMHCDSETGRRNLLRMSDIYRKLALGVFLVAMVLIPVFNWVAAAIPLLFPQLTIFAMYAFGRKPQNSGKGGE